MTSTIGSKVPPNTFYAIQASGGMYYVGRGRRTGPIQVGGARAQRTLLWSYIDARAKVWSRLCDARKAAIEVAKQHMRLCVPAINKTVCLTGEDINKCVSIIELTRVTKNHVVQQHSAAISDSYYTL